MQNIMDEKQHLQAFDSGDSYNAYEYMGSHKVGDGGCYVFRVWAPNALSVSVVGSFNGWNETSNYMSRIGNGDVWECYINGVNEYDVYRYCIETKYYNRLYKSDPYGFHLKQDQTMLLLFTMLINISGMTVSGLKTETKKILRSPQ